MALPQRQQPGADGDTAAVPYSNAELAALLSMRISA
jgi:hypothetical protein